MTRETSSFYGWRSAVLVLLLMMVVAVVPVSAGPLPNNPFTNTRHIFCNVANDAGVRLDLDGSVYGLGNNNTYYIKSDGGGLNEMHIVNNPEYHIGRTGTEPNFGQVTTSSEQSGTFYVTNTGGRGYHDDVILLLSVQDPIPEDFEVTIKSSGYTWTPNSVGPTGTGANLQYGTTLDEKFTYQDFIYGPQTWKPGPGDIQIPSLPLYSGQNIKDLSTQSHLMFIDLNNGDIRPENFQSLGTLVNNGSAKVEFTFKNMPTRAAFNVYGWALSAGQAQGISWTNRLFADPTASGQSGYSVIGKPYADFTYAPTSGTTPLAVKFTDKSISLAPLNYEWDFNHDGVTDSTEQSPVYTYATAGRYSVKLTVSSTAGSSMAMQNIAVSETDPVAAPEFPTMALPAALIIGMLGTVFFIRRTKEN